MSKQEMVSLSVSNEMVRSVLDQQISAAIVAALGDSDRLLENVVSLALNQKVDKDGKPCGYGEKYAFVDVMAKHSVQDAAKEAMKTWLTENSEKIKEAVIKEMKKPKRVNSIAKAFADAVENSIKLGWTLNCNVEIGEQHRERY